MIDVSYTMRCDRCRRYLVVTGTVVDVGDVSLLTEAAMGEGWSLGKGEYDPDLCPHCAARSAAAEESEPE